jgi:LPS sulfotransferase NodH
MPEVHKTWFYPSEGPNTIWGYKLSDETNFMKLYITKEEARDTLRIESEMSPFVAYRSCSLKN